MIISNIINDSFGLLSKQLRFYCWHFRRNLDQGQRQELVQLLQEQHFERLSNRIKALNQTTIADCKQQVSKLLFEQCLKKERRHQLKQLIESQLLDINVRLDNYGRTLLHRSAYNLDVELVKLLIDQGINIRLRDYAGNTALHIAIQSYRNGAVLYGNDSDVVENLTSIVKLLLVADENQQYERYKRKRRKLLDGNYSINPPSMNHDDELTRISDDDESFPQVSNDVLNGESHGVKKGSNSIATLKDSPTCPVALLKEQEILKTNSHMEDPQEQLNSILLEDISTSLVDTKNAFGRTALHYCVLVVGEKHLDHFVSLLISFGADVNITDSRMKTPLYCLVKRPGISAIRQKCSAISQLIKTGCDDLGLSIEPHLHLNDDVIEDLEKDILNVLQVKPESASEPIFSRNTFKRVPTLKHITRLHLIKNHDADKSQRQKRISLPETIPATLNVYVNRRILDQTELF